MQYLPVNALGNHQYPQLRPSSLLVYVWVSYQVRAMCLGHVRWRRTILSTVGGTGTVTMARMIHDDTRDTWVICDDSRLMIIVMTLMIRDDTRDTWVIRGDTFMTRDDRL